MPVTTKDGWLSLIDDYKSKRDEIVARIDYIQVFAMRENLPEYSSGNSEDFEISGDDIILTERYFDMSAENFFIPVKYLWEDVETEFKRIRAEKDKAIKETEERRKTDRRRLYEELRKEFEKEGK